MKYIELNEEELESEIQFANIMRALTAIGYSWELDEKVTIEDMTSHLEMACSVAEGNMDYQQFLSETGIDDRLDS